MPKIVRKKKTIVEEKDSAKRRLAMKSIVSSEVIAGILDGIVWEGGQCLDSVELLALKNSIAIVLDAVYREILRPTVNEFPDLKPKMLK